MSAFSRTGIRLGPAAHSGRSAAPGFGAYGSPL